MCIIYMLLFFHNLSFLYWFGHEFEGAFDIHVNVTPFVLFFSSMVVLCFARVLYDANLYGKTDTLTLISVFGRHC